jgi:uncharacterized protein (TIGR02145 family)
MPWRVPTKDDFEELKYNTTANTLIAAWSYGGYANGSSMDGVSSQANYWSSTENSSSNGYYLGYYSSYVSPQYSNNRDYGFQVRCVK